MILLCFGLFLAAIIGCLVCGYSLVWALLFGFSLGRLYCSGRHRLLRHNSHYRPACRHYRKKRRHQYKRPLYSAV